jgi:hypothetical protein
VAFQRKKPVAIGVKAPFPSWSLRWCRRSTRSQPANVGIHEIKFDGYRVQASRQPGRDRFSRTAVATGPSAFVRSPTTLGTSPCAQRETLTIAGFEIAVRFDVVARTSLRAGEADREIAKLLGFGCVDHECHQQRAVAGRLDRRLS